MNKNASELEKIADILAALLEDRWDQQLRSPKEATEALARFEQWKKRRSQRNALLGALNELVGLHAEQVFICGPDDETKVERALAKAHNAIKKAIQ